MGPILYKHQLQTAQKLEPQQLTHPATIFITTLHEDLVVPGFDEPYVLAPIDSGLVCCRAEETGRTKVIGVFSERVLHYLGPYAVHLLVKHLQPTAKLRQIQLLPQLVPRPTDTVHQSQSKQLFNQS